MNNGISVIVPVYNVEKYLSKALDSLENQTEKNIEIIAIDDGSTDGSGKILDDFKQNSHRDVRIIHKKNEGLGATYNLGILEADKEYVGFLEPDDFVDPYMFQNLLRLGNQFNADVVKSDYYNFSDGVDKPGNVLRNIKKFDSPVSCLDDPAILIFPHASIWSSIYKKSFLCKERISFLNTPGASYQDISFAFKSICLANPVVFSNHSYYHYRNDNNNCSTYNGDRPFASLIEFNELEDFLNTHNNIAHLAYIPYLITLYGNLTSTFHNRIRKNDQDEFLKFFREKFVSLYENNILDELFFSKVTKDKFFLLINNPDAYKKKYGK